MGRGLSHDDTLKIANDKPFKGYNDETIYMQIDKILSSVDWNFSDAPANTGIHAIHPYPAKFIPCSSLFLPNCSRKAG